MSTSKYEDSKKRVIDVSVHNGIIDWSMVAANGYGAIIRCGYGDNYAYQDDKRWAHNVKEAQRFGVPFGVYIYSYAQCMAQVESEAEHVLRCLKEQSIDPAKLAYPIFLDLEEWWEDKAKTRPTWQRINALEAAKEFTSILNSKGYAAGVYASLEAWNATSLAIYDEGWKWVAAWRDSLDFPCDLWQFTSNATVPGVNGRVDLNMLMRDAINDPVAPSHPEVTDQLKEADAIARAIIRGEYGDNPQRRETLGAKYQPAQNRVNQYYDIAARVKRGDFGNQPHRQPAIEALGYDYETVRHIVNSSYK